MTTKKVGGTPPAQRQQTETPAIHELRLRLPAEPAARAQVTAAVLDAVRATTAPAATADTAVMQSTLSDVIAALPEGRDLDVLRKIAAAPLTVKDLLAKTSKEPTSW